MSSDVAGLSEVEVKHLQYDSNGFALVREVSNSAGHSTSGRLVTQQGHTWEVIRIKRGTPGIATKLLASGDTIQVSFEPECTLEFLVTSDSQYRKPFAIKIGSEVTYCGFTYLAWPDKLSIRNGCMAIGSTDESALDLLVDMKSINEGKVTKRVAPGQRVGK